MTWCHVPGTDCPSAQAAEALIWASCSPSPAITPVLRRMGGLAPRRAHRRPARGIFRPGPDLGRPAQLRRPALPRGVRRRPRRISLPALQRRRKARRRGRSPPPLARRRPGHCRVSPRMGLLENVPGHVTLGLETVLRELWGLGYTPAAGLFSAAEVGAPHQRLRIFILAHTDEPASRHGQLQSGGATATLPARRKRWRWASRKPCRTSGRPRRHRTGRAAAPRAASTRADGKSRMDILHYRAEQGFTRPDPAIAHGGRDPRRTPRSRARSGLR